MKRYSLYVFILMFLVSCAAQTSQQKKKIEYLDELEDQKTLEANQKDENEKLVEEYKKKKKILTQIETEDRIEQKKLIKKQEDIVQKTQELAKEIEQKIGLNTTEEIIKKDEKVEELIAMDLSAEELEQKLTEETELSEEDTKQVVKNYKIKKLISSAQSTEDLEKILETKTDLKKTEIDKIVAIKKQVIDKKTELRKETLKKIHARLVRNRNLNIEMVFCSAASKLDRLVISPVLYPFDVHVIDKTQSNSLFADLDIIMDEVSRYPDMMLQLEGNCDYKGSNKYNKALGDRRWSGVVPLLTSMGYAQNRLRGISKGEECPTPKSADDEKWRAENRRTDFIWVLR